MSETERVEKNVDYLKILCKCKSNMRKVILTNAEKDLINTICECVCNQNILRKRIAVDNIFISY